MNRGVMCVTDLISAPDAKAGAPGDAPAPTEVLASTDGVDTGDGAQPLAWAPAEPKPKKKRLALWIGLGLGVLALGAGAASAILIAPGTTVAGIPVGWLTPGAAADTINAHLADTEITLTGDGDGTVLNGADLGASIDAAALADKAFTERPLWNLGAWMGEPIAADITLDPAKAESALRAAVPSSFDDPVDAGVAFDATSGTYVITPGETGTAVDIEALTAAIVDTVAGGGKNLEFSGDPAEAFPAVSDEDATATAGTLNSMLTTIGFYVGAERTVPVAPAVAATWLTVVDDDGKLVIEADRAAIQAAVDALAPLIHRPPVNAQAVVNSAGSVLEEITAGVTGRDLGDVSGAADDFAELLEGGEAVFTVPVAETPFVTATLHRQIDVNLSNQTVTVLENGAAVDSWEVSSGAGEFATHTGSFAVGWKTTSQNMGNRDLTQAPFYFQPDIKWVMYFNGDEAFHGVYWHSNWGTPMSHGCVGMPEWRAAWLFDWAPEGTEVNVHY